MVFKTGLTVVICDASFIKELYIYLAGPKRSRIPLHPSEKASALACRSFKNIWSAKLE